MEKDIVPELIENISADIKKQLENDGKIGNMYRLIAEGKADYQTANEFSEKIGEIYSYALKNNINSGVLPNGKMYYNIADRTVRPALEECYGTVADVSTEIQSAVNKAAGIGIKGITPTVNNERVGSFIEKLCSYEDFEKASWLLGEPVINFAQSAVADTVKINADFQSRSGLSPKIKRTVSGACCDWCNKLAGTYDYKDAPEDIYRRHERCRCQVHYIAGDGKRQNVHTKKWVAPDELQRIEQRKQIGLKKDKSKKYPVNPVTKERYIDHKIIITDKQFGKKIGKHAQNYGLNPASAEDREKLRNKINDIVDNANERRYGNWRGYEFPVLFHIKGNDVVLESKANEFISILEGGINNERVKNAGK